MSIALVFSLGIMVSGCAWNTFVLEKITTTPEGKTFTVALTFAQFIFVAACGAVHWAFTRRNAPWRRPGADWTTLNGALTLDLRSMVVAAVMQYVISVANNVVLGFGISMPHQIMLRSMQLLTTAFVGWRFFGRRYTLTQLTALTAVSVGVAYLTATMSGKVGRAAVATPASCGASPTSCGLQNLTVAAIAPDVAGAQASDPVDAAAAADAATWWWCIGVVTLLLTVQLSAVQAQVQQAYYADGTRRWSLWEAAAKRQAKKEELREASPVVPTAAAPPAHLSVEAMFMTHLISLVFFLAQSGWRQPLAAFTALPLEVQGHVWANIATQYLCIWGVFAVQTHTSALGFTLATTLRKLVSLILSLWYFGHALTFDSTQLAAIAAVSAGSMAYPFLRGPTAPAHARVEAEAKRCTSPIQARVVR